jgi:hypothetical protein
MIKDSDRFTAPYCEEEEYLHLSAQWEGEIDDLEPGDWEYMFGGPSDD